MTGHSGPTPKPSSSILPPTSNENSPQSNIEQNQHSPTSPSSNDSPSHARIASTSTTGSKPEGYPSWLPRRPPPPAPTSTFQSRGSTHAGFDSPDSPGLSQVELDFDNFEPRDSDEITPGPGASSRSPTGETAVSPKMTERKATPRSVRIVNVDPTFPAPSRDASDSTKVMPYSAGGGRAYSKGTSNAISPTVWGTLPSHHDGRPYSTMTMTLRPTPPPLPPRFHTPKFHPTLLASPSPWTRLRFMLWGLFVVFGHLIIQTFLDFNIAYMLVQVAKHPTPSAPGVPNRASGKNWSLATAAFVACWAFWFLGVFLAYEVIYCFWRRWRVKRPLLIPIYLSAPAFNFVSMTSYTNFCFLQYIRWSSLDPQWNPLSEFDSDVMSESPEPIEEDQETRAEKFGHKRIQSQSHSSEGRPPISELDVRLSEDHRPQSAAPIPSVRTGNEMPENVKQHPRQAHRSYRQLFAESCWFYSQNTPTIVLLLPRLALTLALLMAFSSSSPASVASVNLGSGAFGRDNTFFVSGGRLSVYAKVVIWVNLGWGAWRLFVYLVSWVGLWILSGQGCAGICGPRYRWEEPGGDDDGPAEPLPQPSEKRASVQTLYESQDRARGSAYADPDDHTLGWFWMQRTRERVWGVWEFCLMRGSHTAMASHGPLDPMAIAARRKATRYSNTFPRDTSGQDLEKVQQDIGYGRPQKVRHFSFPAPSPSTGMAMSPNYSAAPQFGLGFGGGVGYTPLDHPVLATLPEVSSNPSLATSAAAQASLMATPSKEPPRNSVSAGIPPVFTNPTPTRRGVLTSDLFVAPSPTSLANVSPATTAGGPDPSLWLGSAVTTPIAPPPAARTPVTMLPYPFPAFGSSAPPPQSTKPTLPFPITTSPSPRVPQRSNQPHHAFPTPATTVTSLPFPLTVAPSSETQENDQENIDPDESHAAHDYHEDDADFEQSFDDVRSEDFAGSGVGSPLASGSMSSLGQPLQSRYPFEVRRPVRGRGSSASGVTTSVISGVSGNGQYSIRESERVSEASASFSSPSSASASNSGYGVPLNRSSIISAGSRAIRSQASRSTRFSAASEGVDQMGSYDERSLGEVSDVPSNPGMAGVGAGGGIGPRGSLVNLVATRRGTTSSSPTVTGFASSFTPSTPRHTRKRAGTLPSPTKAAFDHSEPMPSGSGSRHRVSSVPSPPSPTDRLFFAPMPGYEMYDEPQDDHYSGGDDEDEGSQEAAEREDSVGLLSTGPSPRASSTGLSLRYRGSNISLPRRSGGSRASSNASTSSGSAALAAVRSRAASLISPRSRRNSGQSPTSSASGSSQSQRSRASSLVPIGGMSSVPRSRLDSDAARVEDSSQYSDARSRARTSSGSASASASGGGSNYGARGGDLTFGVQIDWTRDEPMSPSSGQTNPRLSQFSAGTADQSSRLRPISSNMSFTGASRPASQVDPDVTIGMPSNTVAQPLSIPSANVNPSQPDLSSADASFVTANPAFGSLATTETTGPSEGSSGNTWTRGSSNRYFVEGSGMWGPR